MAKKVQASVYLQTEIPGSVIYTHLLDFHAFNRKLTKALFMVLLFITRKPFPSDVLLENHFTHYTYQV